MNTLRTKEDVLKKMEEYIWKIFGDGAIGLPMKEYGFIDKYGFTLGSTTEGHLDDNIRFTIDYKLNGVCLDDEYDSIDDFDVSGTWKTLYEEYT